MEKALLLVLLKLLILDIPAHNLISVLNELIFSLLLPKININLILNITSSNGWNKQVNSTRTEFVMLTDANKKINGVVCCFWNENLNINDLLKLL
jgi:hypothetical protein